MRAKTSIEGVFFVANGLTQSIACGAVTSFDTFVGHAAKAYGMPDQPQLIEKAYEEPAQQLEQIKKSEALIEVMQAWSEQEAEQQATQDYNERLKSWEALDDKRRVLEARYTQMLSRVEAWEPPTPDHQDFKAYMVKNIQDAIAHDVNSLSKPQRQSGKEYVRDQIELHRYIIGANKKSLERHQAGAVEKRSCMLQTTAPASYIIINKICSIMALSC